MKIFTVRDANGEIVHRYRYDTQLVFSQWPGSTQTFVEDTPQQDPVPEPQPVRITKLAFLNRFTQAEWIAFDLTALDNPTGGQQERQQKSAMRLFMKKVELAQFIDLSRQDTRVGVQQLEAAGILAAGRAAQILDTPPTAEEAWNG